MDAGPFDLVDGGRTLTKVWHKRRVRIDGAVVIKTHLTVYFSSAFSPWHLPRNDFISQTGYLRLSPTQWGPLIWTTPHVPYIVRRLRPRGLRSTPPAGGWSDPRGAYICSWGGSVSGTW